MNSLFVDPDNKRDWAVVMEIEEEGSVLSRKVIKGYEFTVEGDFFNSVAVVGEV